LCKHCGECGHIQRDCPAHKEETARKEYGDYYTLDLASFIVSSIFSTVAPEIEAFMQFGETFPSLLQLEAPSKTFTELLLILHMQYSK
jgi:hypothetical protein